MSWICGIMIAFDIVIWEQMVTGPEKKNKQKQLKSRLACTQWRDTNPISPGCKEDVHAPCSHGIHSLF